MTARDVEIRVANFFSYRQNLIVPNIHYGLAVLYEMDMVVITKSRYLYEVEIKVTASDIKADLKKRHQHDSNLAKLLFFAVPEKLADNENIPGRAGIISVGKYVEITRAPITNKAARKISDKQYYDVLRLGCMRIWSLKEKLKQMEAKLRPV